MTGRDIRRIILETAYKAHEGHIGSSLCVADIIAVLYDAVLCERSRPSLFVLSKGHAALAQYAALYLNGQISAEQLATYGGDNSLLGVHPQHGLEGVPFTTGSLGQGLGFAVGCAFADAVHKEERSIYVLCSDAECDEGAVWEAMMFAAQHAFSRLTLVIDANHQQALGPTEGIISLSNLAERCTAFGWETVTVDGHDSVALERELRIQGKHGPRAIVAETIFGKGVDFMEGQLSWHYSSMSDDDYERALAALEVGG